MVVIIVVIVAVGVTVVVLVIIILIIIIIVVVVVVSSTSITGVTVPFSRHLTSFVIILVKKSTLEIVQFYHRDSKLRGEV